MNEKPVVNYLDEIRAQSAYGKRWCNECSQYFTDTMCGFDNPHCQIRGSLGPDQNIYRPDTAADNCPHYHYRGGKRWFEDGPIKSVWLLFANDKSDEGVVGVYLTHEKASAEAKKYREACGLDEEDTWITEWEVEQ